MSLAQLERSESAQGGYRWPYELLLFQDEFLNDWPIGSASEPGHS